MKVMGVFASPRKAGNTAWIVSKILEGAKEQGAETLCFHFSELDIQPCRGCNCCKKGDRGCVVNDDMQKLYDGLEQADAIVLGSPVYMGQMSAQAKIFTDRLYACLSPRFSPYFNGADTKKKLILVFSQGNPDMGLFKEYIDYTKRMFELLEFDIKDVLTVGGMRNGPASDRQGLPELLKDAGAALLETETM